MNITMVYNACTGMCAATVGGCNIAHLQIYFTSFPLIVIYPQQGSPPFINFREIISEESKLSKNQNRASYICVYCNLLQ